MMMLAVCVRAALFRLPGAGWSTRVFMANEKKSYCHRKSPVVLFLFGFAFVDGDLLPLADLEGSEIERSETIFPSTGTDVMCK